MKLLVCISNYGEGQLSYLHQVLSAYSEMKHFSVDIILHTTQALDLSRFPIQQRQILCDPVVGRDLAMFHREIMIESQNDYDLFVYSENDILISEQNLLTLCAATKNLPDPYAIGFIRYERNRKNPGDSELYLPDAHPSGGRVYKGEVIVNGVRYAKLRNLHQGCFVLTRDQLKRATKSRFFSYYNRGDPLNREVGATFVYIGCGLQKIIPVDLIDQLLIHHLPDKYVNLDEAPWNKTPPYTVNDLKRFIAQSNKPDAPSND